MEIWLDKMKLPITPLFEISHPNNNVEENLSETGSINISGNKGLRTLEISSFFPSHRYGFLEDSNIDFDPYSYVRMLLDWREKNEPHRLIITETPFNFEVLIEDFTTSENDGTGDVYYRLSLKEYVRIKAIERQLPGYSKESSQANLDRLESSGAGTKKVKKAGKYDTDWTMAKKLTGNGENRQELLAKNNKKIVRVGDVLEP